MIRFQKSTLMLAIAAAMPLCLSAQETTTPNAVAKVLTVDSATVVYVSGDDAVLKFPDGSLQLYESKAGTPLVIDGKEAKPSDLTPGMELHHLQVHSVVHSDVTAVEEFTARVVRRNGRQLTLRLEDGSTKLYRVPHDATFKVNGQDTAFGNITENMTITVTAVKTSGLTEHSTNAAKVARTPAQEGTLVIENQ